MTEQNAAISALAFKSQTVYYLFRWLDEWQWAPKAQTVQI